MKNNLFESIKENRIYLLKWLSNFTLVIYIPISLHLLKVVDLSQLVRFRYVALIGIVSTTLLFYIYTINSKYITHKMRNRAIVLGYLTTALIFVAKLLDLKILYETSDTNIYNFSFYRYGTFLDVLFIIFTMLITLYFAKFEIDLTSKLEIRNKLMRIFDRKNLIPFLVVISITIVGVALRLNGVSQMSVRYDEILSISTAQNIADGIGNLTINERPYSRALLYHTYLSFFYHIDKSVWFGILANIPFYLITNILIFGVISKLANRKIAYIGVFFHAISWVSIAMFREIRFYELFVLVSFALTITTYLVLQEYVEKFKDHYFGIIISKRQILLLLITLSLLLVSVHIHDLTFFFTYGFMIFGFLLFAFGYKIGLQILALGLIAIVAANNMAFGSPKILSLLYYEVPSWLSLREEVHFGTFIIELLQNGYLYILIGLLGSIYYIRSHKIEILYILSIITGVYSLVSLQGYAELDLVRYYYSIFPLLFILTCVVIYQLIHEKPIIRILFIPALALMIFSNIAFGIIESTSTNSTHLSYYEPHNVDFREINDLIKGDQYKDYHIISDNLFAASMVFYQDKKPLFLIDRSQDQVKPYVNDRVIVRPTISVSEMRSMIESGEKVVFINDQRRYRLIEQKINEIDGGQVIYKSVINREGSEIEVILFN